MKDKGKQELKLVSPRHNATEDKPMYNSRTPGLSNTQQKYLRERNLVSPRNCQLRARVSPEEALVNAELEDLSNLLASLESFSGK